MLLIANSLFEHRPAAQDPVPGARAQHRQPSGVVSSLHLGASVLHCGLLPLGARTCSDGLLHPGSMTTGLYNPLMPLGQT